MSVSGIGGAQQVPDSGDTAATEGAGAPLSIPLNFKPHPGQDFESWQTKSATFPRNGGATLEGDYGVGVLQPGTVKIADKDGDATIQSKMNDPKARPLTAAELKAFKARLTTEAGGDGKIAADAKHVLSLLGAASASAVDPADATAEAKPPATVDLGKIGDASNGTAGGPGKTLAGKTETVAPGGKLEFEVAQNQINNVGTFTSKPAGLTINDVQKEPFSKSKPLGHSYLHQFQFEVPKDAKPGTVYTVSSSRAPMNSSADWKFSFKVKVG